MAGATAVTAAGVTASQASTITINLVNDYLSTFEGNHLNADLTGDGQPDVTIANAYISADANVIEVSLNGVPAYFRHYDAIDYFYHRMRLGSRFAFFRSRFSGTSTFRSGTPSLVGSIPIFFKDLHINGGVRTRGSLEVTVGGHRIQLDSFTYNTPDQASTLGLLAMGAGCILALRRWKAEQGGFLFSERSRAISRRASIFEVGESSTRKEHFSGRLTNEVVNYK
jgi:hypothetical protein